MWNLSARTIAICYSALSLLYFMLGSGQPLCVRVILKTLPLLFLIILLVGLAGRVSDRRSYVLAVTALALSCFGDFSGELKRVYGNPAFLAQIAFFMCAQISYTMAFCRHRGRVWSVRSMSLFALLMASLITIAALVLHTVGDMVTMTFMAIYMLVIFVMAVSAVLQDRKGFWFFAVGAFLFLVSDSVIAINTFVTPVPGAHYLIMITYYLAQLLLNIQLVRNVR